MSRQAALVDTDVLSAVMRRHPMATAKAQAYLQVHHQFTFSIITRYEVLRGLKAKGAISQLAAFERLCANSRIIPLANDVVVRAAEIYADLHQRGALISDADILIAASAITYELTLVSNNERHFTRITGLRLENWLRH